MLGLGCKSALAFKEQFTVVSVKNGRKIQASIATTEEGGAELTVVSDKKTDEDNGVTIIIPASPTSELNEKAENFFQYWPENSVLVNGKPPKKLEGEEFADGKYVITEQQYSYYDSTPKFYAVMGGVPYPFSVPEEKDIFNRNQGLVIFADIGDFHFTPSREEMLDTKKTRQFINDSLDEITAIIADYIQESMSEAKTGWEYIKHLNEFNDKWNEKIFQSKNFTFDGKNPPQGWKAASIAVDAEERITLTRRGSSYSKGDCYEAYMFQSKEWHKYFFVTGFDLKNYTFQHSEKLGEYLEAIDYKPDTPFKVNGEDVTYKKQNFALFKDSKLPTIFDGWIDPSKIVSWEDLKQTVRDWKKDNNIQSTTSYGPSDTYDYLMPDMNYPVEDGISIKELTDCKNPFYFYRPRRSDESYEYNLKKIKQAMTTILAAYPDAKFALVAANRVNRLTNLVKGIKEGYSSIQAIFDDWSAKLSDEEIVALYSDVVNDTHLQTLRDAHKADNILDPDLTDKVDNFEKLSNLLSDNPNLKTQQVNWERLGYQVEPKPKLVESYYLTDEDREKYYLAFADKTYRHYSDDTNKMMKEISFYINTKYEKEKV
jgi:hypothetical protein